MKKARARANRYTVEDLRVSVLRRDVVRGGRQRCRRVDKSLDEPDGMLASGAFLVLNYRDALPERIESLGQQVLADLAATQRAASSAPERTRPVSEWIGSVDLP
jgi:hypothetical protein